MNHFRKFRALLLSIAFLFSGILLLYKGLLPPSALKSVKSRIHNLGVDVNTDNKGRNVYAIAFDIDAWNIRSRIPLGLNFTAKGEDLYLSFDSVSLYTITVEPTIIFSSENAYLDVRSILLNNKIIYQASVIPFVISGMLLFLLALTILYFSFFKQQKITVDSIRNQIDRYNST